jgi:hypothetical protein
MFLKYAFLLGHLIQHHKHDITQLLVYGLYAIEIITDSVQCELFILFNW